MTEISETTVAAAIFDRKIRGAGRPGDIRVHELRAIAESLETKAASFFQRGCDDAVEAIASKIKAAAVIRDSSAKIEGDAQQ